MKVNVSFDKRGLYYITKGSNKWSAKSVILTGAERNDEGYSGILLYRSPHKYDKNMFSKEAKDFTKDNDVILTTDGKEELIFVL